jgi:hypothetical protein
MCWSIFEQGDSAPSLVSSPDGRLYNTLRKDYLAEAKRFAAFSHYAHKGDSQFRIKKWTISPPTGCPFQLNPEYREWAKTRTREARIRHRLERRIMRVMIPALPAGKAARSRTEDGWTKRVGQSNLKSRGVWASFHFRKAAGLTLVTVAGLAMLVFAAGCPPPPPPPPPVPTDAMDSCPLPAATFAGWFQSGSVSLNGAVNPANSLNFLAPNCGFYQWSEQMFLWLTSPAPSAYGGGAHIFDSPAFFDVSPPDASGNRTFLAHTPGLIHAFPLRAAQRGPHRLPVVIDRSGKLLEFNPPDPKLKALVRDPSGKLVEIAHARLENGRTVLLDQEGKVIQAQHTATATSVAEQKRMKNAPMVRESPLVQKFLIDGIPIFIDPSLAVIDVEQGQADGAGVLEAQTTANGSLVYYATMVNDVYAYFLTGVKDGAITTTTPNQFPTTQADLNATTAFAMAHGKPNPPFPDPNALAIEVKSSWVVAAGLPNLSSYVTMTATIPTYNQGPNLWTPAPQQTVQLALVGIHVVGSTAGHPEMVWATFEHVGNTPVASYSYCTALPCSSSTNGLQTVSQNTMGTWLFAANGSGGPFNIEHMSFTGPPSNNIQSACLPNTSCTPGTATGTFPISPSDTMRLEPWGLDGSGNPFSNTEVISTNAHVRGMLASGDIRGNYVMTGATWTIPGTFTQVGTNKLSNTTMETYHQGLNCFDCHQGNMTSFDPNGLSHIFGGTHDGPGGTNTGLQPLF